MDTLINAALIIAIVSFFKQQFALNGWKVILAAFLVAAFLTYLPVVTAQFPVTAPWLDPLTMLVKVFLGAAGTVDFITEMRKPSIPPSG